MNNKSKHLIYCILVIIAISLILLLCSIIRNLIIRERLFVAIEKQDISQVRVLLKKGVDVNEPRYFFAIEEIVWHNPTPLIAACKSGNQEIVKLLLEHGADVNYPEPWNGQTPLLASLAGTHSNRFVLAMYLIENGADIHVVGATKTPLTYSITILDSDNPETITQGYKLFEYLIQKNVSKDTPYNMDTLLTFASIYDNLNVVEYLIENRHSDINETNADGMTALIVCAQYNSMDVCRYLLSLGAKKDILDATGNSAIDYAKQNNNTQIIELLRE